MKTDTGNIVRHSGAELARDPEIRSGGMYDVTVRDQYGLSVYLGVVFVSRGNLSVAYSRIGEESRAIDVGQIGIGIQLLRLLQPFKHCVEAA